MTLAIYASSLFSLYHNQPFSFFRTISDSRRMGWLVLWLVTCYWYTFLK